MLSTLSVICLLVAGVYGYGHTLMDAEIQFLKNTVFQEWLKEDMADDQKVHLCNPGVKSKYGMSFQLEQIGHFVNLDPNRGSDKKKTYIYVGSDYSGPKVGEMLIVSKGSQPGQNHAEDVMLSKGVRPTEFWLKNSPCVVCTHTLINAYNGRTKPTIHLMHFYYRTNIPNVNLAHERELSVNCMAKMILDGFKFKPWNWTDFESRYVKDATCKNDLENALRQQSAIQKKEHDEVTRMIYTAEKLARMYPNRVVNDCPAPAG